MFLCFDWFICSWMQWTLITQLQSMRDQTSTLAFNVNLPALFIIPAQTLSKVSLPQLFIQFIHRHINFLSQFKSLNSSRTLKKNKKKKNSSELYFSFPHQP